MRLTEPELESPGLDVNECVALLDRISRSPQLRRASRLRELLIYIGRHSTEKGRTDLHEQEIGVPSLGDHPTTTPARTTSSASTRQNSERGSRTTSPPTAPTKSGYWRFPEAVTTCSSQGGLPQPPKRLRAPSLKVTLPHQSPIHRLRTQSGRRTSRSAGNREPVLVLAGLLAVACIASSVLYVQNRALRQQVRAWQATPVLRSFWGAFFGNAGETDVILADTSFALEEDILKTAIPLSDYINYSYRHLPDSKNVSLDTKNAVNTVLSRNNGSISDFRAARRILMLDPFSPTTRLRFARDYTPDALKRDNVILIGSRKSNPWVDFFQDQLEFRMDFDADLHQSGVRNLRPLAGEPEFYAEPQDPATNVGYGVVAFLPNIGQTGDALIIEGTDSQATEAAGEFVTDEQSMALLKRRLNSKTFPYFQLLLKTSRLSGTPFTAQIITLRTYPTRNR